MNAPAHYTPTIRRVVDFLDAGELGKGLAVATQALAVAPASEAVMLLCMLANGYVIRGEALPGLRMADRAHRHALNGSNRLLIIETKQSLAFALQALDKHALAIDLVTECETAAHEVGDLEMVARCWRALGISMSILGRHTVAIDYLARALDLFGARGYFKTRTLHAKYSLLNARSRALSADTAASSNDFLLLHNDWEQFTHELALENQARLHAMALGNAAISARRAGRLQRALEQFRLALALQSRMELHAHCAMTEGHMAGVLAELGELDAAIAAYERGIALFQHGNPRSLANALEEYSELLEKRGRFKDALAAVRRAREVERTLNDDAGHAAVSKIERDNEIAALSTHWTRLAEEDPLTRLPNRRAFDLRLNESQLAAQSGAVFSITLIDIDFFKRINDELGHDMGDHVLREVGALIAQTLRPGAFAARIGGEEFALLCYARDGAESISQSAAVIDAIRNFDWSTVAEGLAVTASAGLVRSDEFSLPNDVVDVSTLLKRADERLYRAKREGRDRMCHG